MTDNNALEAQLRTGKAIHRDDLISMLKDENDDQQSLIAALKSANEIQAGVIESWARDETERAAHLLELIAEKGMSVLASRCCICQRFLEVKSLLNNRVIEDAPHGISHTYCEECKPSFKEANP